nr:MAG TPA: hypothetical protein [Caudoviricetes sp.]
MYSTVYTGSRPQGKGRWHRLSFRCSFRESCGVCRKVFTQGDKDCFNRANTDGKLHEPRRRKGIYNGYSGRRSRVCRKQGGSRTGAAGKRTGGSGGLSDGQRRLYEHTGRDRRRTAVYIGTGGSRRQYIKRRWQQDRTGHRKGSRTRHNAPSWSRNKKLHIFRGYVKIKP